LPTFKNKCCRGLSVGQQAAASGSYIIPEIEETLDVVSCIDADLRKGMGIELSWPFVPPFFLHRFFPVPAYKLFLLLHNGTRFRTKDSRTPLLPKKKSRGEDGRISEQGIMKWISIIHFPLSLSGG